MKKKEREAWLRELDARLPQTATVASRDLVTSGLAKSDQVVFLWRKNEVGPPYTYVGGNIRYDRNAVLEWAREEAMGEYEYD